MKENNLQTIRESKSQIDFLSKNKNNSLSQLQVLKKYITTVSKNKNISLSQLQGLKKYITSISKNKNISSLSELELLQALQTIKTKNNVLNKSQEIKTNTSSSNLNIKKIYKNPSLTLKRPKYIKSTSYKLNSKNHKKNLIQIKLFTRNLYKDDINYIDYLLNDLLIYIKNNTNNKKIQRLEGGNKIKKIKGGESKIEFNILYRDLDALLSLDNLHDFAINERGGVQNISKKIKNINSILNYTISNNPKKNTISTFEENTFNYMIDEYKNKNRIFFITVKDLEEYLNGKLSLLINGDIFVDTSPVLVNKLYDIKDVKNNIASYFDPSPISGDIARYDNDIIFFNEALQIIKKIYVSLVNIDIKLINDKSSKSENFKKFKYSFEITKNTNKTILNFTTGSYGDFTVPTIRDIIINNRNDYSYIFNDDEYYSFLLLMKGLGDFSQLYLAFKTNDVEKINLLTTVDKFLFTISLYCNMNKSVINSNKDLYLLLGTGNTSGELSDTDTKKAKNITGGGKRKRENDVNSDDDIVENIGHKILIYNNKDYFKNKSIDEIIINKYNDDILIENDKNGNILLYLNYIDINNINKKIKLKSLLESDYNTVDIDKKIKLYTDISNIFDYSKEVISGLKITNEYLKKDYKESFEELIKNVSNIINSGTILGRQKDKIIKKIKYNFNYIINEIDKHNIKIEKYKNTIIEYNIDYTDIINDNFIKYLNDNINKIKNKFKDTEEIIKGMLGTTDNIFQDEIVGGSKYRNKKINMLRKILKINKK